MAEKTGAAAEVVAPAAGGTGTTTISEPPKETKAGGAATTVGTPNGATSDGEGDEATLVDKAGPGTTEEAAKPVVEKSADEKPAGAPEKYEFKFPEGVEAQPEVLKNFEAIAKKANLPQEAAQELVNLQVQLNEQAQQKQAADWAALKEGWKSESMKLLGPNSAESLALVARARDESAESKEFAKLMNESGFGDHPAVIKYLIHRGKQVSEDTVVAGKSATGNTNKTIAEILYPNLKP